MLLPAEVTHFAYCPKVNKICILEVEDMFLNRQDTPYIRSTIVEFVYLNFILKPTKLCFQLKCHQISLKMIPVIQKVILSFSSNFISKTQI